MIDSSSSGFARESVGRWVLTAFAVAAIIAGVLELLGILGDDRSRAFLPAVGAIGGGVGLLKFLSGRQRAA